MRADGPDPGRAEREAARAERAALAPHRRAVWAAGSVGAANGCVVGYGILAGVALGATWGVELSTAASDWRVTLCYALTLAMLLGGVGLTGWGSSRALRGLQADGQGVHLGLVLAAGGAALVTVGLAAFGVARDYLAWGNWSMPCCCLGSWPSGVAAWNLLVLLRHGHALRAEDVWRRSGG